MADTIAPSRSSTNQADQHLPEVSRCGDPRTSVASQIGPMRAYARALVVDGDAADVFVTKAIAKACEEIDRFAPEADIRTWLFGILRSAFDVVPHQGDGRVANVRGPLSRPRVDGHVTPEEFTAAFNALGVAQREALFLTVAAQMSFADAAAVCKCSVITLKRHAIAGRTRLAITLFVGNSARQRPSPATSRGLLRLVVSS
ncbi:MULTISPECIES: hypothetical protein [unclassified Yoonia]|uniref:hypothetical protein n=1 Tax=unclassified Yoonia TaxID=2629118 RepID=UPI002AFF8974|nr:MULTISPECIES: hypothetical protein [unclassified Yoonia]